MMDAAVRHGLPLEGMFTLVGLDVLVDEHLKPWLLEVNAAPNLNVMVDGKSASGRAERDIKERVVSDLLSIVGILPEAPLRFEPVLPSLAMLDWLPAYERLRSGDLADLREVCRRAAHDPRIAVGQVRVESEGDGVLSLIDARHGHRIELDPLAAMIWRSMEGGASVGETVRAVASLPDAEAAAHAEQDVWQAMAVFVQTGAWERRAP
jgi:hypothetical protein